MPLLLLEDESGQLDISAPRTVWFRRLGAPGLRSEIPSSYRSFCLGEAEQALEGLLSLVRPDRWINEYWACRRAANKSYQYSIGHRAGLSLPDTLISNSTSEARTWLKSQQAVIAKSIHSPVVMRVGDTRSYTFTNRLNDTTDREDLAAVEVAPVQFQTLIPVDHELRVTSIRGRHFVARIDILGEPDHGVRDWRSEYSRVAYSHGHLPTKVGMALTCLMDDLNIDFAASDFIVTPDGDYFFLEANPHGAWLWLETELAKFSVSDAIAQALAP